VASGGWRALVGGEQHLHGAAGVGEGPHHHGTPVQVDPIEPKLKLPGTERLKLKWDEPLTIFAFKFNLRRYIMGVERKSAVGRCRLTLSNPC
jgi:hypothetical protein